AQQFRQPKGRYFCDHCGSARCPHSQQPTGDKSVPSAPGSRQKSRASQQASRGDAITMATTPTTSGQQPQPGRIRSAVTVERLDEGLKPVASDPAIQTATAAASAGCLGRPRVRVATERLPAAAAA
uniref:Zn(2)-C6 fungal-type domain-containing protein n=1 Tax=Macrostomum lignano TaxID=282301 RepID=A0A1I8F917_9PLAT